PVAVAALSYAGELVISMQADHAVADLDTLAGGVGADDLDRLGAEWSAVAGMA
ncbi:MAG: hypothetical protein K0S88_2624, partial [Actinomycetia bacterium]|nr:hypothetical protein [Actinomycetes bacterium]